MAAKAGNVIIIVLSSILALALLLGRFLGVIGVLGLLALLIGWYKSWWLVWIIFVVVGFVSAAVLEQMKKRDQSPF